MLAPSFLPTEGNAMKFGNRASLQATLRKTIDVPFPDEDTFYRLREMSGTERDRFEIASFKIKPNNNGAEHAPQTREIDPLYLRARLVASCLVDESGERIYTDKQVQECSDELSASVLNKLFNAAQKLNGLEATAVEDAAKNSASDPQGDLPSGSQDTSEKPSLNS